MKTNRRDRTDPERYANDTMAGELVDPSTDATRNSKLWLPSSNPATNLVIAEVVLRSLSVLARKKVRRRVARASYSHDEQADQMLRGRTILSTLALYGAGKFAARSPLGLGVVASTLVAKTLYDRGRTLQRRRSRR